MGQPHRHTATTLGDSEGEPAGVPLYSAPVQRVQSLQSLQSRLLHCSTTPLHARHRCPSCMHPRPDVAIRLPSRHCHWSGRPCLVRRDGSWESAAGLTTAWSGSIWQCLEPRLRLRRRISLRPARGWPAEHTIGRQAGRPGGTVALADRAATLRGESDWTCAPMNPTLHGEHGNS